MEPLRSRGLFWSIMIQLGSMFNFLLLALRYYIPDELHCAGKLIPSALAIPLTYFPIIMRAYLVWFKYRWNEEKLTHDKSWFHNRQWVLQLKYQFLFYILAILVHVSVELIVSGVSNHDFYPNISINDPNCLTKTQTTAQSIVGIYLIFAVIHLTYLLYGEVNDTYHIKDEIKCCIFVLVPIFIVYLIVLGINPSSFDYYNILLFIYVCTTAICLILPVYFSYADEIQLKSSPSSSTSSSFYGDDSSRSSKDDLLPHMYFPEATTKKDKKSSRNSATPTTTTTTPDSMSDIQMETVQVSSRDTSGTNENGEDDDDGNGQKEVEQHSPNLSKSAAAEAALLTSNVDLSTIEVAVVESKRSRPFGDTLVDVLTNKVFLEAFVKFTTASWCVENVIFYKEYCALKEKIARGETVTKEEMETIKLDFLQNGSRKQLNLPSKITSGVTLAIDSGSTDITILDPVFKAILIILRNDIFPRFRQSTFWKDANAAILNQA